MPEKHLFEYAVIRVVPRMEREEFMNVGVILYCQRLKFLQCRYIVSPSRLQAFSSLLEIAEIAAYLAAFDRICIGGESAGPIGKLELASRFRWLTATRSTIVQTSKVHPGFTTDAEATLCRLFEQLVL